MVSKLTLYLKGVALNNQKANKLLAFNISYEYQNIIAFYTCHKKIIRGLKTLQSIYRKYGQSDKNFGHRF